MKFDWKLYVQLSDELITAQKTQVLQEARLRSAISRAYYGAFGIARNFLLDRGTNVPQGSTHKFVREQYLNSLNREEKKIGNNLGALWENRKDADYEGGATVDINRAITSYELATRILDSFKI